jgi:hypothetical protein
MSCWSAFGDPVILLVSGGSVFSISGVSISGFWAFWAFLGAFTVFLPEDQWLAPFIKQSSDLWQQAY